MKGIAAQQAMAEQLRVKTPPTNPVEVEPEEKADTAEAIIEAMNALHVEIGEKAAKLALDVLEAAKPEDIPIPAAVSLLKFGVDLQRKARLGQDGDNDGPDPFADLVKVMTPPKKKEA